jgi:hypothetical protein
MGVGTMSNDKHTGNSIDIVLGLTTYEWKIRPIDIVRLEVSIQVRRDERIGWNQFLSGAATWNTEDWLALIWAGMLHLDKDQTIDQVAERLEMQGLSKFQMDFIKWIECLTPESLKKKAKEL